MDDLRQKLLGLFAVCGIVPPPIEATFRHVINQMTATGMLERLDEEEISGALLGGFAAAYPLCLGIFTETMDEAVRFTEQHKCAWAQYSKSRTATSKDNEADSGADFALVIWTGPDTARVALFQAKRFEASRPTQKTTSAMVPPAPYQPLWPVAGLSPLSGVEPGLHHIDVHRARFDKNGDLVGRTQMATLAQTARRIMAVQHLSEQRRAEYAAARVIADVPLPERPAESSALDDAAFMAWLDESTSAREKKSKAERRLRDLEAGSGAPSGIQYFNWLHYLGYARSTRRAKASRRANARSDILETGAVCVPVSALAPQLSHEERFGAGMPERTLVDLSTVICHRLVDVILNAFSGSHFGKDVDGWISLDASTIEIVLPDLQRFGHLFMGTDKGGASVNVVKILKDSQHSGQIVFDGPRSIHGYLPRASLPPPGLK
ncbi:hypothetical protein FIV34_11955 [Luteibacter pinisoli]|uniref:Uncharacterized protein n=1 Tax=Luteibacter pinisoli TaxID=2589080 RepID=A0A4Y5Z6A0_9GAMM|nr:hypothetical protein [Luteibacter pinisoli]QDE39873.1 hypothetical protein FIV34_11955 [Luteibacter pinisoli]